MPMNFIGAIVVGAIVGWLASIVAKTNNQMGCLWNIFIGIVGGMLGNWLALKLFGYSGRGFSIAGFFVSIGGAVLLIMILRGFGILRRDR